MPPRAHSGLGAAAGIKSSHWLEGKPRDYLAGPLPAGVDRVNASEAENRRTVRSADLREGCIVTVEINSRIGYLDPVEHIHQFDAKLTDSSLPESGTAGPSSCFRLGGADTCNHYSMRRRCRTVHPEDCVHALVLSMNFVKGSKLEFGSTRNNCCPFTRVAYDAGEVPFHTLPLHPPKTPIGCAKLHQRADIVAGRTAECPGSHDGLAGLVGDYGADCPISEDIRYKLVGIPFGNLIVSPNHKTMRDGKTGNRFAGIVDVDIVDCRHDGLEGSINVSAPMVSSFCQL